LRLAGNASRLTGDTLQQGEDMTLVTLAGSMLVAAALAVLPVPKTVWAQEAKNAGPYVPSPQSVVADMLKMADVRATDFVIDLGSGDGRIVLTAAKVFGARGFGVEIQDDLVRLSNEAARREGLSERVRFMRQDLFKTDISQATVLTMYLLPDTVNMLREKLFTELRPGTRVISHDYGLNGWIHDQLREMDLQEKIKVSGVTTTLIYVYTVPAKVAGTWALRLPAGIGSESAQIRLEQEFHRLSGRARIGGKDTELEEARMKGEQILFKISLGGKQYAFTGVAKGDAMEGTIDGLPGKPWRGSRR